MRSLKQSEQNDVEVQRLQRHCLLGLLLVRLGGGAPPGSRSSAAAIVVGRRLGLGGLPMGLTMTMLKMMLSLLWQRCLGSWAHRRSRHSADSGSAS